MSEATDFIKSMLPEGVEGTVFLASDSEPSGDHTFRQHPVRSDDFDAMERVVREQSEAGRHVWFNASVFEGTERKKGKPATAQAVWTDVDRDVSESERRMLADAGFTLNESGTPGRLHVWARLRRPVDGAVAAEIGKRLSDLLGGEKDGYESLLRVPGVPNRKPGAGMVRTIHEGKDWTPASVKAWIGRHVPQISEDLSTTLGIFEESRGAQIVASGELDEAWGRNNSSYAAACSLLTTLPEEEAREQWEELVYPYIASDFTEDEAEKTWESADQWTDREGKKFREEPATESELEKEIAREVAKLRIRDEAKKRLKEEKALEEWKRVRKDVPFQSLTKRLADYDPDTKINFVVEDILPEFGNVVFSAQDKAGKTTFSLALVKALADGGSYLNRFSANKVGRKICYMNVELAEQTADKWLSDMEIQDTDRVITLYLRGREQWFGIESPEVRHVVAREMERNDIGVLIIDPIGPLWDAAGIDESDNSQVGPYMVMLGQMAADAKIDNVLVIQHAGHTNGDRARGASKILGWPDAVWSIRKEGKGADEKRFFRAYGRDVKVPEARFTYDDETKQVTVLTPEQENARKAAAGYEAVITAVVADQGITSTALRAELKVDTGTKTKLIDEALANREIHVHKDGQSKRYYSGAECASGCP